MHDEGTQPMPAALLPNPDRDSAPWWAALASQQLQVQVCGSCGHCRWPARAMCNRCGSFDTQWETTTGTGTVAACTTTHHAFLAGFPTPYHTVLVRVDVDGEQDDIVMPGGWSDEVAPVVGQIVEAVFKPIEANGDSATLLFWRARENGGRGR